MLFAYILVSLLLLLMLVFFFFNDPSPTESYTLSLHDALPICDVDPLALTAGELMGQPVRVLGHPDPFEQLERRSEEHTSELQSRGHLVCRLLLEKKKTKPTGYTNPK